MRDIHMCMHDPRQIPALPRKSAHGDAPNESRVHTGSSRVLWAVVTRPVGKVGWHAVCYCELLCAAVSCCELLCAAVSCCVLLCAAVSCCVLLCAAVCYYELL